MSMLEAVSAPRIIAVSDSINVSNRVLRRVTDALLTQGYDIRRNPQSYALAALHGIELRDGVPSGGADPQREGMAVLVRCEPSAHQATPSAYSTRHVVKASSTCVTRAGIFGEP